ncbi:MAG: ABC transporter substrate-binding protein [Acidimicrobiales bacterium]
MGVIGAVRKWGTVGAAACMLTLGFAVSLGAAPASAGGLKGQYGSLPKESGKPAKGGIVSFAEQPSAGPTYIFPITPASDLSVFDVDQFQDLFWAPLWWSPKGPTPEVDYSESVGLAPKYSDDNKTVTITLKSGWTWSDGTPVTSTDVEFMIDLLKAAVAISPANDGDYTPGLFPDNLVSMSAPNATTLVLKLSKTYNQPFIQLDQLGALEPLPAQAWSKTSASGPIVNWKDPATAKLIYKYLNAQSSSLSTYGTNPLWQVVDGPFKIQSFDPSTDATDLVANTKYTGTQKPHIAGIDELAFTSTSSEFDQLLTGKLDVGYVDFSDLAEVPTLIKDGYNVWGYPEFGWEYIVYNFKDKTGDFGKIISQLYIRQALAHLQDEPALLKSKGVFDNAGGEAFASVPAVPTSPYTPANAKVNPYPYSISAASTLLKSHGWDVKPGGTTTCAKPGTGSNECGAGIPKGTPLSWNLLYSSSPAVIASQDEQLASAAKQIGITISLSGKTFDYLISNLSDVSNPNNDNLWAMDDFGGFSDDLYPSTNEVFNTTGSFNLGGFSNPTVDQDILNSASSQNTNAVKIELDEVAKEMPGLFQIEPDMVFAFKNTLSGPKSSFESLSEYQPVPQYWYFKKS